MQFLFSLVTWAESSLPGRTAVRGKGITSRKRATQDWLGHGSLRQQPGPFLGTPVSSKPGTFQDCLQSLPQTVSRQGLSPREGWLLGGVVRTGGGGDEAISQTSSGLSGLPREPQSPAFMGPHAGKRSLLMQRKSVGLRFDERARRRENVRGKPSPGRWRTASS